MQLLHEQTSILTVKDFGNMNTCIKDVSSHNIEVKEKRSSNASILMMNPVASGDNMQIDLNNGQKLKEELPTLPQLVPCCEGKELQCIVVVRSCSLLTTALIWARPGQHRNLTEDQREVANIAAFRSISEDLVHSGLSAISVKHDSVIQCLSMSSACERLQVPPGLVKHRNSFRSLHRPDLKRVPYLRRMTPDELESLFRGYADIPKHEKKRENTKETRTVSHSDENNRPRIATTKLEEGNGNLHTIPKIKSGAEDIPAGMRLHGARARLYTSVLAGAKTGDQLDNISGKEETPILVDAIPEDDIPLYEELQIILPPRCDDVTAGSSAIGSENSI